MGGGREEAAAPSGTSCAGADAEREHDRRIASAARHFGRSDEATKQPGFKERVGELMTGFGMPLAPELRAGIPGILDCLTRRCTILDVNLDRCSAASSNRAFVGRSSAAPRE
ncbi:MAG: hypothetical protein OXI01_02950 [Albidovulum sp.]|nr:hypothetical protein [Albidovulum sp.]